MDRPIYRTCLRIAPVYLLAIAILFFIVFASTEFHLTEPLSKVLRSCARWISLGMLSGYDINGYDGTKLVVAGVTWTLQYEWMFYASLPIVGMLARLMRFNIKFMLCVLAANILALAWVEQSSKPSPYLVFSLFFVIGMATAGKTSLGSKIPDVASSIAVTILAGLAGTLFLDAYSLTPALLLVTMFYLVASGSTVFGLMTSRPAKRLGEISYGVYLLHGLVLFIAFSNQKTRGFAMSSPYAYWSFIAASSVIVVLAAVVAHVVIERPAIRHGRTITQRVRMYFQSGAGSVIIE